MSSNGTKTNLGEKKERREKSRKSHGKPSKNIVEPSTREDTDGAMSIYDKNDSLDTCNGNGFTESRVYRKRNDFQEMKEALSIIDYFDLSENMQLMDLEKLTFNFNLSRRLKKDYLGEQEIRYNPMEMASEEVRTLIERSNHSSVSATSDVSTTNGHRAGSRKSNREQSHVSLDSNEQLVSPKALALPSYEERLLAKPRVTYKVKQPPTDKASRTKLGKSKRKLIKAYRKQNNVEVEDSIRPVSVRKELKRIFLEKGFPDWQLDPEQESLAKEELEKIKSKFAEWMFLLSEGFSIILYGYGSKICVFEALDNYLEDEYTIMELDGLFPKLDATETLLDFVNQCIIIEHEVKGTGFLAKLNNLMPKLRPLAKHPPVILLVRNIEQICWKNEQLFRLVTDLTTLPFVHLIASCDHFNSPLVFDEGKTADMSLIWIRCTTYSPYVYESKMIPGTFGSEAFEDSTSRVTLEHVYGSVTAKAKRAFNILASLQLQGVRSKQYDMNNWNGIEFNELSRNCREKFIANNDAQLNSLLTEFIDNKLISRTHSESGAGSSRGRRGGMKNIDNCLRINLDDAKLEEFLLANPVQNA